jgi:ATP-dependent Lon protease
MELIDVSGYLLEEKVVIAQRHLLPKQMKNHGLEPKTITISNRTMSALIDKYTKESGVRMLDKTLAGVCRKIAVQVAKAKGEFVGRELKFSDIEELLGVPRYSRDMWSDDMLPGVVTGLAWTSVGGEILFVETSVCKGKGKLTLTGNLGDVMKESAVLALEYVKSNAALWGLEDVDFEETSFHIHVPEGAIPKDGPSAGITMMTSIVSALTKRKVKKRFAMTGEITLRGKVLPVGGIKEKILAAKRSGITDIVMSEENRKDVEEIKELYVKGLNFHYVKYMSEVLEAALETEREK